MKRMVLLALLLPALAGAREVEESRPYVGLWGAHSKITKPAVHRITDRKAWTALWLDHVGVAAKSHSEYYNKAGVPDVDFTRCMVVAILQGERWNSAGVSIHSIVESGKELVLRFDDRSYQTAGPDGGGERVTPYGFFVIARKEKALVVKENVQNLKRGDPEWKERARFAPPASPGRPAR